MTASTVTDAASVSSLDEFLELERVSQLQLIIPPPSQLERELLAVPWPVPEGVEFR